METIATTFAEIRVFFRPKIGQHGSTFTCMQRTHPQAILTGTS
jgi:hypothetical protein